MYSCNWLDKYKDKNNYVFYIIILLSKIHQNTKICFNVTVKLKYNLDFENVIH
jgi:hypothetical protein